MNANSGLRQVVSRPTLSITQPGHPEPTETGWQKKFSDWMKQYGDMLKLGAIVYMLVRRR